jgi:hypothetical protein
MDKALAESYMQRHPELVGKQPQQQVVAQPAPQRGVSPEVIGIAGMGIGVVAFIAVLVASQGHLWWMFWPIMAWFGWWRFGGWGHRDEMRQARYQARAARWQARAARYGGYYNGYPQAQEPQQPQAQPPLPQQQPSPQVSAPYAVPPPQQQQPPTPVTPTAQTESRPSDVPPVTPAG